MTKPKRPSREALLIVVRYLLDNAAFPLGRQKRVREVVEYLEHLADEEPECGAESCCPGFEAILSHDPDCEEATRREQLRIDAAHQRGKREGRAEMLEQVNDLDAWWQRYRERQLDSLLPHRPRIPSRPG